MKTWARKEASKYLEEGQLNPEAPLGAEETAE
jgi:hypothetical protein